MEGTNCGIATEFDRSLFGIQCNEERSIYWFYIMGIPEVQLMPRRTRVIPFIPIRPRNANEHEHKREHENEATMMCSERMMLISAVISDQPPWLSRMSGAGG